MIQLIVNTHDYENDVRVMTQAFYPDTKLVSHLAEFEITRDTELFSELSRLRRDGLIEDLYEVEFTVVVIVKGPKIAIRRLVPGISGEPGEESGRLDITPVISLCASEDMKLVRNQVKRELYALYSEATGKTLPWGTLTGIRPCKIPTKLLEEGQSDERIREHLKEEYLASDKKAALALEVAKVEQKLLSGIDYENGYSLYVGIPFCPTTCLYCSFTSYPISMWKDRSDAYVDALCKELSFL